MKCDDLRAHLDGEGNLICRVIMFFHLLFCISCRRTRAEWTRLSPSIRRLEDVPVPRSLRDKLLADAMATVKPTQEASHEPQHSRIWEASKMKRLAIALSCAAVLILALLLFPTRKQNSAFAAVSRAMSGVKSIHFSGQGIENGVKHHIEAWVENPSKIRMRIDGQNDQIVTEDRSVVITSNQILVKPLGEQLKGSSAFLKYFDGDFWRSSESSQNGKISVQKLRRQDGRFDTVFTSIGAVKQIAGEDKLVITVNGDSNRVTRIQQYNAKNALVVEIDRIEYDIPIPDSVFHPKFPKSIPVIDLAAPVSTKEKTYRESEYKRLASDENAILISHTSENAGGSNWTPIFHPGYVFESMDNGEFSVFYLADKDVYRVIGTAKVYDGKYGTGFATVVRDKEIKIPRQARLVETLISHAKPGEYRGLSTDMPNPSVLAGKSPGDPQIGAFRFVNIGPGLLTIKWNRIKKQYVIEGKAKLLPFGDVYKDQVLSTTDGYKSCELITRAASLSQPDLGNIPAYEVEIMKAELTRQIAVMNLDRSDWYWPERGVMSLEMTPAGSELPGPKAEVGFPAKRIDDGASADLRFQAVGPTRETDIVNDRAKREFKIIGNLKLLPSGKIVRNGVVTYDGKIMSSE